MLICNEFDNEIRWRKSERLDRLFEDRCDHLAEKSGDYPAIIHDGLNVSYLELDILANKTARYLKMQGLGGGDRIGILLDKSVETYVTMLAVLKINAAYVPLDSGFPKDRIAFMAEDADFSSVISTEKYADHLAELSCPVIHIDQVVELIANEQSSRLSQEEKGSHEDQLCYIIYTSGSTGKPKGVAIDHPSICNFVRGAGEVYGIKERDRVYQGMTIAFDFSVEEIWVPLIAGGTLIPGKSSACRLGDDLADFLLEQQVSVMCCVPTLLATIEKELPRLRLLIVGGEACPHELVVKWHKPGRTILNTYGPTEATVTATWTELVPDKAVTIGQPMPSYTIVILDESLQQVEKGKSGEICIAGIGLARGYLNRDDLTDKCFIPDFLNISNNPSGRIYRTGDLGQINKENEIVYLGRIDTQVKIRGYRIELTEIESVLLQIPEIEQAVVSTFTPLGGMVELVAFCKLKDGVTELPDTIQQVLAARVPGYMIPAFIEKIDKIPMLPSNKADRKKLPVPSSVRICRQGKAFVEPTGEMEQNIARAVADALNIDSVSVEDDIFDDLGGHSLVTAMAATRLRKISGVQVGLKDFYDYPTVKELARFLIEQEEERKEEQAAEEPAAEERYQASDRKTWAAGAVQLLFVISYMGILASSSIVLLNWITHHPNWQLSCLSEIFSFTGITLAVTFFLSLTLPIILKWLLLGTVEEGSHKLWGIYFLRWWMVQKAVSYSPHAMFAGTVMLPWYYRLMGSDIGADTLINTPTLHAPYLIQVGSKCSLGHSTQIFGYEVRNGFLILAKVSIADNCFVGANSVIMPHSAMGEGSCLGDQSLLPSGVAIPAGESWAGSTAVKESGRNRSAFELEVLRQERGKDVRCTPGFLATLAMIAAFPLFLFITTLSSFSSVAVMYGAYYLFGGYWFLLSAPLAGFVSVGILCLLIIVAKRMVMYHLEEGIYEVNSMMYVRKWAADMLVEMSLVLTNSLYATLYLPPFLRLLGAKIGKHSEISTISHITPCLLDIGDESFLADIAHVGPSYFHKGLFAVKPVKIGKRAFVGNAAFVPSNTTVPDESLIGVLSIVTNDEMEKGSSWLGSPAFFLPRRQVSQHFDESLTFAPSRKLYLKRLAYEFFRIILPSTFFTFAGGITWMLFSYLLTHSTLSTVIALTPWLFLIFGIGLSALVVLIKKLLIGRYTPKVKPLWDVFVRRSELVTGLYENVVVPSLLGMFTGTPFAAIILRSLGVTVGKRCYIETTFITEFDLVTIGDDSAIGPFCSLQTHLFEDRVMKMSHVTIGSNCAIAARAVVLYDSVLEDGSSLDALSLVMKGEELPKNTRWQGSPSTTVARAGVTAGQEVHALAAEKSCLSGGNSWKDVSPESAL